MANWTGPVQLGCCAPCPPGFIWNSPLPEISLELLVHKNEMKYPRRARIFALFLNIRQFLKESPWGLAWCRCNILMNYIWKALIPEVLLVWFGPSPNPLSSSVAPKLLVVPCPLLSKVSWGCWATGRIKKKKCASCLFLWLLSTWHLVWQYCLVAWAQAWTFQKNIQTKTSFLHLILQPTGGVTMRPRSAEPKTLIPKHPQQWEEGWGSQGIWKKGWCQNVSRGQPQL